MEKGLVYYNIPFHKMTSLKQSKNCIFGILSSTICKVSSERV